MIWEDAIKMLQEMQLRFDALEQKRQDDELTEEEATEYWKLDEAQRIRPEWIKGEYDRWKGTTTPVDAPAASGQELRPQAPAITHETDH